MEVMALKLRSIHILAGVLLFVISPAAQADVAWDTGNTKHTNLSVFAAMDTKSDESGYGAALSIYDRGLTDLSYVDLGDFRVAQFAKLSPKQIGMYSAYFGFALAHADPKVEGLDAPDGMLSGLSLIMAETDLAFGLSVELRATSLSKDFDPIAWFTDPDVLWLGAGVSYTF